MELRQYQKDVVTSFKKNKNNLLIAPTGSGKTLMIAAICKRYKLKPLIIAHRKEILRSFKRLFLRMGLDAFYSSPQKRNQDDLIYGCDVVVIDEAHHIAASSFDRIAQKAGELGKKILGATATPYRSDGLSIKGYFDSFISTPSIRTLSYNGFLAKVRYFYANELDFFAETEALKDELVAEEKVRAVVVAGDVNDLWDRFAKNKKAIIFCCSISHAKDIGDGLVDLGKKIAIVEGKTPKKQRFDIERKLRNNEIDGVVNCEIYTEGVDLPKIGAVIMLRPTKSRLLYKQMIGRGLRPDESCTVIDCVGNYNMHGDVLDEDCVVELAKDQKENKEVAKKREAPKTQNEYRLIIKNIVDAQFGEVQLPSIFENLRGVA